MRIARFRHPGRFGAAYPPLRPALLCAALLAANTGPMIADDARIVETLGQDQGKPFHQLGLRHWLAPDRVQLDATYGNRNGGGTGERWFSIRLRLLSVPFLP
ncbi:hypothetical protein [Allochromatium tepidum]|uniref:Alginate export domain-containing protein n=1 Tax=Allochromatium tepidum TaxID=553982 RepID=A0ABM7QL14_9GAMM|nr:hypothetical protein [Allochromatium tepidum]BCU06419.1 hypothetical protein Atep_10960 [Allochromatium tepidum]